MESPITTLKNALNPSTALKWAAAAIVVMAILDLSGLTNWILFPVTTAKSRFGKGA